MKSKAVLAILGVVLLASVTSAGAAEKGRQGKYEASAILSAWAMGGHIDNMAGVAGNFLAYYTNDIAVGARVEFGFGDDSLYSVLGEGRHIFAESSAITPYVGILVGPGFLDTKGDTDPTLKMAGIAGGKVYLNNGIAMFAEIQAGMVISDDTAGLVGLSLGLAFDL